MLAPEPADVHGALKTSRKGWGRFALRVEGRSAHAGAEPLAGRSAIREIARQILRLEEMNDPQAGVSVTVGVVRGGIAPNVVPVEAEATVDLRVRTAAQAERFVAEIRGLLLVGDGVRLRVTGGMNRPPFPREAAAHLYDLARRLAQEMGVSVEEIESGGVRDGNFSAALGVPTLDGRGAVGSGAHASARGG